MNKAYIISGTLFGDEGKGTFVDYLANEKDIHECVRYNGGSQACHTVIVNDEKHRFSQLGSNMFDKDNRTYLSSNTVVNPFNLYREAKVFSENTNQDLKSIINRVYIDESALVVTPYHALIGKLIELTKKNPRGITGSGVSTSRKLMDENNLGITMNDLLEMNNITVSKIRELYMFTRALFDEKKKYLDEKLFYQLISKDDISNLTDEKNKDYIIDCYKRIMSESSFNTVSSINDFNIIGDVIMEGSQGLLIDRKYGIKPNTTYIDTTNHFGVRLACEANLLPVKVGASRAFASRHGRGLLITKDSELQNKIIDNNQTVTYFQGSPTYGWYDAVLMRYSQRISNNDEIFISGLDLLSGINKLKVCNAYSYKGKIDDEFIKTFEFVVDNGQVIITNIINHSDSLKEYLERCTPLYIEVNGWNEDISEITEYNYLPQECIEYIELLESLVNVKITLCGVGPDRNNKIRRLVNGKK